MPTLNELKGKYVVAVLKSSIFRDQPDSDVSKVRIVSVEAAGLWVESDPMTKRILQRSGQAVLPRTPVFFVPFSEITLLCDLADYPALSEKALGLEP